MNLKEIRVSRKLKVQEVSDYLCCLPSVYSRYENGKREPSIDILLKLSKLYGVSVDCLIGNDEVVDTSITEKEAAMISAMRQADERARQDAIALLELHASKKKMDLIVCASVSRFARNISDLIEEVRKLRTTNPSNPVGVYFETEDLYTLDPNINERLQMQGLFAEWESGNKSRRMILSYDQRICTGQFPLSDLLGLRHTIEGGFIIEEEEAKTVKYIFLATLCGCSDAGKAERAGRTDHRGQARRNTVGCQKHHRK